MGRPCVKLFSCIAKYAFSNAASHGVIPHPRNVQHRILKAAPVLVVVANVFALKFKILFVYDSSTNVVQLMMLTSQLDAYVSVSINKKHIIVVLNLRTT